MYTVDCFQDVVSTCVDNCVVVDRTEFLYQHLFDCFSRDAIAKAVYLESLEPYILNATLTSVTPAVMKDFVDHYQEKGSLQTVQSCILHMNVASLDIHQVQSLHILSVTEITSSATSGHHEIEFEVCDNGVFELHLCRITA